MKKSEATRQEIIHQAAELFNIKGYSGSSISDVMERTGLKKGGIYNHFSNKEELSLAAFEHSYTIMREQYVQVVKREEGAIRKLLAFVETFRSYIYKPPIKGGCPIMNSSSEVDDTNPRLSAAVRGAALDWEHFLEKIIIEGIRAGEIHDSINATKEAINMIASLEGGIMLGKLHRKPAYMHAIADQLIDHINTRLKKA